VAIGAMATGGANLIKVALQLLLPIMARLLGPNEFGLYALALPTVSLVSLLADGGLGATLAREQESSSLVWSSAFWALLLMGATLALGSAIFGKLLGYLADQPRLPGMIALLSLSLIFLTLSAVPAARLTRRKKLGIGAGADLAANLIGAMIAVTMAWNGMGAWSLAAQYVVVYAVRAALLNLVAFSIPALQFSFAALRPHLISGGILIASRICEYTGRAAENFATDRLFGTNLLGSYNFANQVSKFATDATSNVVWAALYVQALTEDKSKIVILHRQLCRLLGVLLFPATFLAAAAAPELVSFLLGPKWPDLSFMLRVFLPLYALAAISVQTGPILLAYGRFDIQFWCMLGLSVGRVIAIGLGFWLGLSGAVYAVAIVTFLFCVAMLVVPAEVTGCRPGPVLLGLVRPAISSVLAAGAFSFSKLVIAGVDAGFLFGGFATYSRLCYRQRGPARRLDRSAHFVAGQGIVGWGAPEQPRHLRHAGGFLRPDADAPGRAGYFISNAAATGDR
jgi:PST family polysaccharide transporter